jgi:hypothetical protein
LVVGWELGHAVGNEILRVAVGRHCVWSELLLDLGAAGVMVDSVTMAARLRWRVAPTKAGDFVLSVLILFTHSFLLEFRSEYFY